MQARVTGGNFQGLEFQGRYRADGLPRLQFRRGHHWYEGLVGERGYTLEQLERRLRSDDDLAQDVWERVACQVEDGDC